VFTLCLTAGIGRPHHPFASAPLRLGRVPTPFFLSLTAFPTYFPLQQEFVERQGDEFSLGADSLLYNGPYTITELNPSSRAVLEKNGRYWDKENVDIEKVNLRVIKDDEVASTACSPVHGGPESEEPPAGF
jgi:ABC-type transport system substrate-binding protein